MADVDDKGFKTLYHYDDNNGFCIFSWVDDIVVTIVSTNQSKEAVIMLRRSRPRDNQYNKQFLLLDFGERALTDVEIPRAIDYYNLKIKSVIFHVN